MGFAIHTVDLIRTPLETAMNSETIRYSKGEICYDRFYKGRENRNIPT